MPSMNPWVIVDDERYLVYDAGPPSGKPMTFDTQAAAEKHMRAANWHFAGMLVGKLVDGELAVAEGTHTLIDEEES